MGRRDKSTSQPQGGLACPVGWELTAVSCWSAAIRCVGGHWMAQLVPADKPGVALPLFCLDASLSWALFYPGEVLFCLLSCVTPYFWGPLNGYAGSDRRSSLTTPTLSRAANFLISEEEANLSEPSMCTLRWRDSNWYRKRRSVGKSTSDRSLIFSYSIFFDFFWVYLNFLVTAHKHVQL